MRHPDLPADLALPPPWQAELRLRFAPRAGRTALVERRHRGPLMVQKPLYPEGAVCHAVIIHPPAGIAGGDGLDIDIRVDEGAHAVLATPGATKWYKSLGRRADQHVRFDVAPGGRLDWLPQENIVFDDARAGIATTVTVAPGGSAIGWDALVFGRQASGERWSRGTAWLDTEIRTADGSLWIEAAQFDAESPLRFSPVGLDGLPVLGTLWAVGANADVALAEALAERLPYRPELRAGISCLAHPRLPMLLLRVAGAAIEPVRALLIEVWSALREPIHGVAARPLRLWRT